MTRAFLMFFFAAVGCSGAGLEQQVTTTTHDGTIDANTGQTVAADGSHVLASLDDVCSAPVPAGYVNPTGAALTAAVPTGRAVLALLQPSYTGTYTPQGVPAGYTWNGSLTPSAITIGTAYAGGTITCSAVECSCDPPGPCGVDRCGGPFVTVAIDQTVQTADGVFDERVPSTVGSPNDNGEAYIEGEIPATALHGTYQISFGTPAEVKLSFEMHDVLFTNGSTPTIAGGVSETTSQISGGGGSID
jgi:hypothetical protein